MHWSGWKPVRSVSMPLSCSFYTLRRSTILDADKIWKCTIRHRPDPPLHRQIPRSQTIHAPIFSSHPAHSSQPAASQRYSVWHSRMRCLFGGSGCRRIRGVGPDSRCWAAVGEDRSAAGWYPKYWQIELLSRLRRSPRIAPDTAMCDPCSGVGPYFNIGICEGRSTEWPPRTDRDSVMVIRSGTGKAAGIGP